MSDLFFVHILRRADGSYYTGSTHDLEERWHRFKEDRVKERVLEWLESEEIEPLAWFLVLEYASGDLQLRQ